MINIEPDPFKWADDFLWTYTPADCRLNLEPLQEATCRAEAPLQDTGLALCDSLMATNEVLSLPVRLLGLAGIEPVEGQVQRTIRGGLLGLATAPDGPTRKPLCLLLQQGVVLLWGAVDAFASDLLQATVAAWPALAKRVGHPIKPHLCNAALKVLLDDKLEAKDIARLALRENGVQGSMENIRKAYRGICPGQEDRIDYLAKDPDVQLMEQWRHAIVHREGRGAKSTDVVEVKVVDVGRFIGACVRAGQVLLDVCSAAVRSA